jgi:hypothetical protein
MHELTTRGPDLRAYAPLGGENQISLHEGHYMNGLSGMTHWCHPAGICRLTNSDGCTMPVITLE